MNGIVINIDPVALHIGHFVLNWYNLRDTGNRYHGGDISTRGKEKRFSTDAVYSVGAMGADRCKQQRFFYPVTTSGG